MEGESASRLFALHSPDAGEELHSKDTKAGCLAYRERASSPGRGTGSNLPGVPLNCAELLLVPCLKLVGCETSSLETHPY